MAKKVEKTNEVKVLDKTNQQWYQGKGKITFCSTIEDLIGGKGETYDFTEKMVSQKIVVKDDKTFEQQNLIVFILAGGKIVMVRKRDELK